jgi:hypothetical protein
MPKLGDAFLVGLADRGDDRRRAPQKGEQSGNEAFDRGASWVRQVLVHAIEVGNEELQQHKVNFRLDLNLDPRSTNHAHADFWLCEVESHAGQLFQGPKYSINVLDGRDVWLYKPGAPGRVLGTIDDCGEGLREALRDAAEEGGRLFRH